MAKDLKIRLSVFVPPPLLYWGLIGACLAILPAELSSENVTLNSYYPAPSGVYQKILTTQATWLGRDPGGYLDVGTQAAPGATFWGSPTKLAVMDPVGGGGGRVGINTTTPADRLEVDETAGEGGIYINGASPAVQLAGGAGSLSNSGGSVVLQSSGKILVQQGAGASALAVSAGNVGFLNPNPAHAADVGGDLVARGACVGAVVVPYTGILNSSFNLTVNCPNANYYATWISGVMSNCQSEFIGFTKPGGSDGAIEGAGEMLCCPCPPGGCPNLPAAPGGICP